MKDNRSIFLLVVFFAADLCAAAPGEGVKATLPGGSVARRKGALTFNKDVAPIVFQHCAGCHRPGQSGPFNLLTFADVKKRTKQIAEVVEKRYMPPWLPERGLVELANNRSLSVEQIGLIRQWVSEGAVEGDAADLP